MESYIIDEKKINNFYNRYKGFFPSLLFLQVEESSRKNCVKVIPIRLKENY